MRFALVLSLLLAACGAGSEDPGIPADHFPCGDRGDSCEIGVEVCVDDDSGCTKCEPIAQPCDASDHCSCLPDPATLGCANAPTCEPSGDGLVVLCEPSDWGCG